MMRPILRHLIMLLFIFCCSTFATKAQTHIVVGDKAPIFSLKDQDGKLFNMADQIGKSVLVIYFYPKDESMVCTKEACAFRDSFDEFTKAGAKVIGINSG